MVEIQSNICSVKVYRAAKTGYVKLIS